MINRITERHNGNVKELFLTGFFQVFFVSVSTYMISHHIYIGAFIASFAISYLWTHNVRKIVASTIHERISYSMGAATGSISGLAFSQLLISVLI
jgi:uncharacterized membrane protein